MKIALVLAGLLAVVSASPTGQGICGKTESGSRFHPDCTKFFVCNNGFVTEQSCPLTLYFNGVTCDYPANVHDCIDGFRDVDVGEGSDEVEADPIPEEGPASEEQSPVEPSPEDPEPVEPVEPVWEGECPNATFYYLTNPSDANAFFVCLDGVPSGSGKCGEGLVFSQAKQYCH